MFKLNLSFPFRSFSSSSRLVDVVVIGGGHAGVEAATASARTGASTVLLTQRIDAVGELSCNPSFGGIGKGILMREIDALDGVSPKICGISYLFILDRSGIHFRVLNASRGPAVQGPRAQIDRLLYKKYMMDHLCGYPNLNIIEGAAKNLFFNGNAIAGVSYTHASNETLISAKSIVIATGTFLFGEIHIGDRSYPAGRMGESPSHGLSGSLFSAGFKLGRMRTGTPPRLLKSSINFSSLFQQEGDKVPLPFSFLTEKVNHLENQLPCHQTYTADITHQIVRENLSKTIHLKEDVHGPRYCPSLETKIIKFPTQKRHVVWLEPEGNFA